MVETGLGPAEARLALVPGNYQPQNCL